MNDNHQFPASNQDQMGQLENLDNNMSGTPKLVGQEMHSGGSIDGDASGLMNVKTPNSYKYPLLKRYYDFGPWVGRNRKAICLGCRLQTSSSQPDRLLKHLNKCAALTEEDKVAVTELMNERTANKRKKPGQLKSGRGGDGANDDDSFYEDDAEPNTSLLNELGLTSSHKKMKREKMDRNSQIDEALTRFIMVCSIRLEKIQSKEFLEFARLLNQDYRVPNIETIKSVLIPRMLNII